MITSSQNPKIQQVRALLSKTHERDDAQLFVAEGVRLVEEAITSGWLPIFILYSTDLSSRGKQLVEQCIDLNIEALEVLPDLLTRLSDTGQSQGVLAVLGMKNLHPAEKLDFVVVMDAIRDPGNMGTMLRTAAAAGIQAVWIAPNCVDIYSPKVVRSAMGAHFKLPLIAMDWAGILQHSQHHGLTLYLSDSSGGMSCWEIDLNKPVALIICNEAEGASAEALSAAYQKIHIPMPGQFESLNASAAAAILLFESVRQRTVK